MYYLVCMHLLRVIWGEHVLRNKFSGGLEYFIHDCVNTNDNALTILPLLTGCTCICAVASALGCVFGTVFMLDVAFLGWSSVDAVQGING